MGQIDLFKNYSYSTGPSAKKKKLHKNVNMNVQWTRFSNLSALNSTRQVDMPLKSIIFYGITPQAPPLHLQSTPPPTSDQMCKPAYKHIQFILRQAF